MSMRAEFGVLEIAAGENCPDNAWALLAPALADLQHVTHVSGISWVAKAEGAGWHSSDSGRLQVKAEPLVTAAASSA